MASGLVFNGLSDALYKQIQRVFAWPQLPDLQRGSNVRPVQPDARRLRDTLGGQLSEPLSYNIAFGDQYG